MVDLAESFLFSIMVSVARIAKAPVVGIMYWLRKRTRETNKRIAKHRSEGTVYMGPTYVSEADNEFMRVEKELSDMLHPHRDGGDVVISVEKICYVDIISSRRSEGVDRDIGWTAHTRCAAKACGRSKRCAIAIDACT